MRLTASNSVAVGIAGLGMAAVLAGCTSPAGTTAGGGAAAGTPAGGTGTAASSSAPAPAASGSSGSAVPTASAGASTSTGVAPRASGGLAILPCPSSGLRVAKGAEGAAAGSSYLTIDFTNTSGRTCTLFGYPGVALTTGMSPGSEVGDPATRATTHPAVVITLTSGQTATALVQIVDVLNYPTTQCEPVSGSYLQVYPPGQTAATYLPFQARTCARHVFAIGVTTVQGSAA